MDFAELRFSEDRASAVFNDLKTLVDARLKSFAHNRFTSPIGWVKAVFWFALGATGYAFLLAGKLDWLTSLALGTVSGVAVLMLALNASHDAAHGSFSRKPWINFLVLGVPFAILGVDPTMWRARHVMSHHRFPNIDRCDADIDENPFIRLSPRQSRRFWHRYQHVYAWLLYFVVAPHAAWIQDFNYMKRTSLANMADWQSRRPRWPRFLATKSVHVLFFYVLPLSFLPFLAWKVFGGICLVQGLLSLAFILPLIGTHFTIKAAFPRFKAGEIGCSYVWHQLTASVDWQPRSRLSCELIGGLNAHAAHHLFPKVSHSHYPWISAEIQKFCDLNELPYNQATLREAIHGHFLFLKSLAKK